MLVRFPLTSARGGPKRVALAIGRSQSCVDCQGICGWSQVIYTSQAPSGDICGEVTKSWSVSTAAVRPLVKSRLISRLCGSPVVLVWSSHTASKQWWVGE